MRKSIYNGFTGRFRMRDSPGQTSLEPAAPSSHFRPLLMEHVLVIVGVMVGIGAGYSRIGDNSTLVHLTTGLNILRTHHVPRSDPYSFTAHGDPWVVQSWLVEVLYAVLYKAGGAHFLQLLDIFVYGLLGGLITHLCRTGNWLRTVIVGGAALCIGISEWSPRPTEFAFLFLALTVLVVQRRHSGWWLVPIGLLWVNCHGSWPLGILYTGTITIGAYWERSDFKKSLQYLITLVISIAVGGLLSPFHVKMLTFPLVPFGNRAHAFSAIVEWMSPNFHNPSFANGPLVLMAFLVMIAVLFRNRPRWTNLLPFLGFTAAALVGLRNLPMLGIIAAPILGDALHSNAHYAPPVGKRFYVSAKAGRIGWAISILIIMACVGITGYAMSRPGLDLSSYPQAGVRWLDARHLIGDGHRVYAPDYVGCYIAFEKGYQANIFIDDRYDMYPIAIANDSFHLNDVDTDLRPLLAKYNFDAIIVPRGSHLASYLAIDSDWNQAWTDKNWEIFLPRDQVPSPV